MRAVRAARQAFFTVNAWDVVVDARFRIARYVLCPDSCESSCCHSNSYFPHLLTNAAWRKFSTPRSTPFHFLLLLDVYSGVIMCCFSSSLNLTLTLTLMPTPSQVEFRVGDSAPVRPVAEKAWLKPTGSLPLGSDPSTSRDPNFDLRTAADGGCDSPAHFEGCHVYYIKVCSTKDRRPQ